LFDADRPSCSSVQVHTGTVCHCQYTSGYCVALSFLACRRVPIAAFIIRSHGAGINLPLVRHALILSTAIMSSSTLPSSSKWFYIVMYLLFMLFLPGVGPLHIVSKVTLSIKSQYLLTLSYIYWITFSIEFLYIDLISRY
jgi:hypothetical protein